MSMSSGGAIYVDDDRDLPSESDDEDERLDCVHDIHSQRQMAGQQEFSENYYDGQGEDANERELSEQKEVDLTQLTTERKFLNDTDMEGDIEDTEGMETERRHAHLVQMQHEQQQQRQSSRHEVHQQKVSKIQMYVSVVIDLIQANQGTTSSAGAHASLKKHQTFSQNLDQKILQLGNVERGSAGKSISQKKKVQSQNNSESVYQ